MSDKNDGTLLRLTALIWATERQREVFVNTLPI